MRNHNNSNSNNYEDDQIVGTKFRVGVAKNFLSCEAPIKKTCPNFFTGVHVCWQFQASVLRLESHTLTGSLLEQHQETEFMFLIAMTQ